MKNSTIYPSSPRIFETLKHLRVVRIFDKFTGSSNMRPSSSENILG